MKNKVFYEIKNTASHKNSSVPEIPRVDTPDYIFDDDRFEYPEYRPAKALAPLEKLLTVDYLGKPRSTNRYQPGALLDPPLDGSPISVDPRQKVR